MKYIYFLAMLFLLSNCGDDAPNESFEHDDNNEVINEEELVNPDPVNRNGDSYEDVQYNLLPPHLGGRKKNIKTRTLRPVHQDSIDNLRVNQDTTYSVPENNNYLDVENQ